MNDGVPFASWVSKLIGVARSKALAKATGLYYKNFIFINK